jgi:hypothetical protein
MIKLPTDSKKQFIEYCKTKGICLEGNILKVLDTSDDPEWEQYVSSAIEKDTEIRKKRLDMTKQIQAQNIELTKWKCENEKINAELKSALSDMEKSKELVLNDLDVLQKKTQYQLIETIVKVSLWVICGVGVITTLLFGISLFTGVDNKIVESAWSNMFGILLTNSFSIIGTIMGVKYASEHNNKSQNKKCECDCK